MPRLADALSRAAAIVRRVIGAPDYELYLAHVQRAHPGMTPLTHEQFVVERMARRYGSGAGRCC